MIKSPPRAGGHNQNWCSWTMPDAESSMYYNGQAFQQNAVNKLNKIINKIKHEGILERPLQR
jgi:hypothetical protein